MVIKLAFKIRTALNVLSEKEVRRLYGNDTTAIDHLIELDTYNICIQDKFEQSSPCISKINHFIQCVTNISIRTNKICLGIYLSLRPLTLNSLQAFEINNNTTYNKFISINNSDEFLIINNLIEVLYQNYIFLYEDNGTCIMYDINNSSIIY